MRLSKISSRIESIKESAKQFQLSLEGSKTYWIDKGKMTTSPQKGQTLVLSFYLDVLCAVELDGKEIYALNREQLLSEVNTLAKRLENEIYQEESDLMKAEISQTHAELLPILRHRLALFKLSFPKLQVEIWLKESRAYELAQNLLLAGEDGRIPLMSLQNAAKFAKCKPNDDVLNYAFDLLQQIGQDVEMYKELGSYDDIAFASKMFFCKTLRSQSLFGKYCTVGQLVKYQQSLTEASKMAAAVI